VTGDRRFVPDAGAPAGGENDVGTAGQRIASDENAHAVDAQYHFSREHIHRCSRGHDPSAIQQDQSVAVFGGKVQVVEYGNNRHAGPAVQVP